MCLTTISSTKNPKRTITHAGTSDVELATTPPRAVEVIGTWDFKWAPGTKIRIAFQTPIDHAARNDFTGAKQSIEALARTWLAGGADIDFDFSCEDLPPADDIDPQKGSPLLGKFSQYDVLVSLDPLPRTIRDPRTIEPLHRVLLPRSELGAFARRADHNVPTLFIGPIIGRTEKSLAECYSSDPLARFYVVHEFGHVLGLPHEHQNPKRQAMYYERWREVNACFSELADVASEELRNPHDQSLIAKRLGLRAQVSGLLHEVRGRVKTFFFLNQIPLVLSDDVLDDFIYSQLIQAWPGNADFSDWRDEPVPEPESIMSLPFLGCFLGFNQHQPDDIVSCKKCRLLLETSDPKPTPSDLAHLAAMYGSRK